MTGHVTWPCGVPVKCKADMLVVAGSIFGWVKIFFSGSDWKPFSTFKRVKELGKDVLRYSNTDRIMVQSGTKINLSFE